GAEVHRTAAALGHFQAEDVGGVAGRAVEVAGAQAHVGDVAQFDHEVTPRRCGLPRTVAWAPYSAMLQSLPQAQCEAASGTNWRGRSPATGVRPSATTLKYTPLGPSKLRKACSDAGRRPGPCAGCSPASCR